VNNQNIAGAARIISTSAVVALLFVYILSHLADVTEPVSSNRFAEVWVMTVDAGNFAVLAIPVGSAAVGMWLVHRYLGLSNGSSLGIR